MTMSSPELNNSVKLFDLGNGRRISVQSLKNLLPTVEVALFFAKVYKFNYIQLSDLIRLLFKTDVIDELMNGEHSTELQSFLVETIPEDVYPEDEPAFVEAPPPAEILPELWESLEIDVSSAIEKVAQKLADTLDLLPGKQGQMIFSHMAKLNRQRPTVGVYQAGIHHPKVVENLVIFDVSGSMTEHTVRTLMKDVVALSWKANAHLAIVSNSCFHWEPGSYNVDDVLSKAEYGGTYYDKLTPLLQRDWGTVVTIADYDSSRSSKDWIRDHARGHIGQVLDISLVNRPTFLAECVGQLADEVRPLLIGTKSSLSGWY